ncbi:MAG: hypothetical protein C4589_03920 [Peptococcaceae bacterium]|nr:MAG: hypothetical protein C4589_03920 [Peptococcaceae bacterium]
MYNCDSYIESFCRALDDEIKFEREQGGTLYRIVDGDLLAEKTGGWIYFFNVELELSLPDDTPIRVEIEGKIICGHIISVEGFEITIFLEENNG